MRIHYESSCSLQPALIQKKNSVLIMKVSNIPTFLDLTKWIAPRILPWFPSEANNFKVGI